MDAYQQRCWIWDLSSPSSPMRRALLPTVRLRLDVVFSHYATNAAAANGFTMRKELAAQHKNLYLTFINDEKKPKAVENGFGVWLVEAKRLAWRCYYAENQGAYIIPSLRFLKVRLLRWATEPASRKPNDNASFAVIRLTQALDAKFGSVVESDHLQSMDRIPFITDRALRRC
ncbi:hypothetical protein K437DRAFT_164768 [Tilletiaria anomala UBC 951]|uniref:Uncharacterized protein n=1 Tax=Tilletiaria anomala (strain ATCC 24038 / CBS 436.72 / UBC 951) TaxID=1037660 RepID=A0A066VV53_TILAU|nr:uncharacterized protein K437DRAFT_164768 [Tilletiaria anomala UBC 951]KDN42415.1 hypothetical protein K437DRAFT_164768 [Tilletiaria anomala UBC 951]